MNTFLLVIAIIIAVLTAICLYRIAAGPTVFDRIIASGMVGTNGFILLILIGLIYGRLDMFVDLAIAYALLNFIVIIAFGKYFERRKEKPE